MGVFSRKEDEVKMFRKRMAAILMTAVLCLSTPCRAADCDSVRDDLTVEMEEAYAEPAEESGETYMEADPAAEEDTVETDFSQEITGSNQEPEAEGTDYSKETDNTQEPLRGEFPTASEVTGDESGFSESEGVAFESEPVDSDPMASLTSGDILAIMGEGIDPDIDSGVDAVREIYSYDPSDEGIRQMAADNAGLLDEDRQNGTAVSFLPADTREDSMAYVSAFILSRVQDGSGDFDSVYDYTESVPGCGYDWKGNDSSDHNGVIRTHDEVIYVLCYSTALNEPYIYHTISGTRLMLEYSLPASPEEAEFNLTAMSWMKGENGGPSLLYEYEDGHVSAVSGESGRIVRQILVGYRDLPDETGENGSYDVPGAGTVNCVIRILDASSGREITPSFSAWLAKASGNNRAANGYAEPAGMASGVSPTVRVTSGLWMRAQISAANVDQDFSSRQGFRKDGRIDGITGRRHAFQYRIYAGKPNGSEKGVDSLMDNTPVEVSFSWEDGATDGYASDSVLLDAGTMGNRTGAFAQSALNDAAISGITFQEKYGVIEPDSLTFSGNGCSFRITGMTDRGPGQLVTAGILFFQQKEVEEDQSYPHYWITASVPSLKGTAAHGDGTQEQIDTSYTAKNGTRIIPSARSENTLEASGRWHAHVMLKTPGGGTFLKGTGFSMDSSVSFGERFNVWSIRWWKVTSANRSEKAANGYLLWDNRKFRIAENEDGDPAFVQFVQKMGQYQVKLYYITKADGTAWNSEEEMKQSELLGQGTFETLRYWPTYREAKEFLASKGMPDGSHVCGILTEIRGMSPQSPGVEHYQCTKIDLETIPDEDLIGTSGIFTHSWITWRSDPQGTMGSTSGQGTVPDTAPGQVIQKYYIDSPRTYTGTVWNQEGIVEPSSLTGNNHYHQGNSLYIRGWRYSIAQTFENGLEAMTVDPASEREITCVIKPSFADGSRAVNAACLAESPNPGSPLILKEVYMLKTDGTKETLIPGSSLPVSDFVSDGTGTLALEMGDVDYEKYRGRSYYLKAGSSGKEIAERNGVPAVLASGNEETHEWELEAAGGAYRIRNAGSGHYLTVPASLPSGDVPLQMSGILSGDAEARQQFYLISCEGGVKLVYAGDGTRYVDIDPGNGETLVLSSEGSVWNPEPCRDDAAAGIRVRYEDITSEADIPPFYAVYEIDPIAAAGHEPVVFQAAVSGDQFEPTPSKSNGHLANVSLSFVNIEANVLKETVDRAYISNGETLLYTISYENLSGQEHTVDLTWQLPADNDEDGTSLAPDAMLTVGEAEASGSAGSTLTVHTENNIVHVTGVLKSGETAKVTIPTSVSGASGSDVIRSHAVQQESFGPVLSNRVETRLQIPHTYTLMTGGPGTEFIHLAGLFLLAAIAALTLRRSRYGLI